MTTKNILSAFVVCLLAGAALAKPTAFHEDYFKDFDLCKLKNIYYTLKPSENDNNLKPTIQLMKVVMFDLQDLGLSYVSRAKVISDHLLKDPVVMSSKQPEFVKFKQNMKEFEQKYADCKEMEELFDLMDLYSNATARYYEMAKAGTLSAESQVIYDVLKKYSLVDLDEEYENRFLNSFVSKFGHKVAEIKEHLKKEEGEIGVKILQWWDETKTLKTPQEKMEAFKEYMKLYGIDDE